MSESNGFATREEFLAPSKRRFTTAYLPTLQKKVRIRSLHEGEKERYEAEMYTKRGDGLRQDKLRSARRRLVVLCVCDENGDQLLSDADTEQLKQFDGADLAVLDRVIRKHIGITDDEMEDMVGNSNAVNGDSSPSE